MFLHVFSTLVLAGAQDRVTPIEDSEDMVAQLDPAIVRFERFAAYLRAS